MLMPNRTAVLECLVHGLAVALPVFCCVRSLHRESVFLAPYLNVTGLYGFYGGRCPHSCQVQTEGGFQQDSCHLHAHISGRP